MSLLLLLFILSLLLLLLLLWVLAAAAAQGLAFIFPRGCECLLSAKYGQGMEQLLPAMRQVLTATLPLQPSTVDASHVEKAFGQCISVPSQASHAITESLDRVLLHPWFGLPIFFAVMLLVFQGVFAIGKPLQDAAAWVFTEGRTLLL